MDFCSYKICQRPKVLRIKDQFRQGVIELLQAFRPLYDNDPID